MTLARHLAFILTFVSLVGPLTDSHAMVDLAARLKARSYPLSGIGELETGKGWVLWGEEPIGYSRLEPWYGYIRSSITLASAGTYHSISPEIEFFPVAFLGFKIGTEAAHNEKDYSGYDCLTSTCRGWFTQNYWDARLGLKTGVFFFFTSYKQALHRAPGASQNFIEPSFGLRLDRGGQLLDIWRAIVGIRPADDWSFSLLQIYTEDPVNANLSRMQAINAHLLGEEWTVTIGAGFFQSPLRPLDFTAHGIVEWKIWPGLGLL